MEKLNGCIVQIESNRFRGRFIDANPSKIALVTGCPRSKRPYEVWTRWIVHHRYGNVVSLESVRYPDRYLDMNTGTYWGRKRALVTHCDNLPPDWGKFDVIGSLDNCRFRSERWKNRWLDAHPSKYLLGNKSESFPEQLWASWRIVLPCEINETWQQVDRFQNKTSAEAKTVFTVTKGMVKTVSSSLTKGFEISTEMQKNFGVGSFASGSLKFGAKFHATWMNMRSTAWTETNQLSIEVVVPPHSTIKLEQLVGQYGVCTINGDHRLVST